MHINFYLSSRAASSSLKYSVSVLEDLFMFEVESNLNPTQIFLRCATAIFVAP